MEVEQLDVSALAGMAAPYNPRRISDHDLEALRRSLRFFGTVEPIVANRRSGRIVGGHQRVRAAEAEGLESLPVVWVDLDEPSEQQLNLALNRISGDWDDEKLRAVLQGLEAEGADLAVTGFEDEELARLLQTLTEGQTDPDAVPSEVPARCEKGDLWTLGRHRLLCGDATSAEDVDALIGVDSPSLCLTDPPYGIDLDYDEHEDSTEALRALIAGFLPLVRDRAPAVVLTSGISNQWLYPMPDWVLCWFYGGGQYLSPWGFNCWQPILCYGKDPKLSQGRGSWPDAVNLNTPANAKDINHPCPKPVAIWEWLIERCSNPGNVVLDVFAGSGTTIIACEKTARAALGLELSPRYCDVILQRWEQFTGKQAERVT